MAIDTNNIKKSQFIKCDNNKDLLHLKLKEHYKFDVLMLNKY